MGKKLKIKEGVRALFSVTFYGDKDGRCPLDLLSMGYEATAELVDQNDRVVSNSFLDVAGGGVTVSDGEGNVTLVWADTVTEAWCFECAVCQVDLYQAGQRVDRITFELEFIEDITK